VWRSLEGAPASARATEAAARAWIPIGAGLALFAMLGMGTRADLAAHLFGLLSGVAIGALLAVALPRRPGAAAQWIGGAFAAAIVVAAWIAAVAPSALLPR
jgi:membrane associated rhomboid family serine protease